VHWLFALPLLATLGACVVLVRSLQLLTAESRALIASAERLEPLASAVGDATRQARRYGATVASATRRYTPRHG
jgi:hypothetical protein